MSAAEPLFAPIAEQALETTEALAEIVAKLSDLGRRMQNIEAVDGNRLFALMQRVGKGVDELSQRQDDFAARQDDFAARLDAFGERLTVMERKYRRPPAFPITVIETKPSDHPMIEDARQRAIEQLRGDLNTQRARHDGHEATFNRMRQAFATLGDRLAVLEKRFGSTKEQ
jgi:hypothetical protein